MCQTDPLKTPEWQALHREASLVSQIIGSGVTALGRASYGNCLGEYYTAFFGLSIGIERLAKLILVADYALDNRGALPNQDVVKNYGHKLKKLVEKVDKIAKKRKISVPYLLPTDPICAAVIDCLDAFSDASKGRYANFEAIGNPNFNASDEPVNKWWTNVVEPILAKHYRGKRAEARVQQGAESINAIIGDVASVRYMDETGGFMTDLTAASERTGSTQFAQKYGRFYTLSVVRWLAYIFDKMTHTVGCQSGFGCLFGHYEYFQIYQVADYFLRKRKVWPLR